jgi:hypothetical protein
MLHLWDLSLAYTLQNAWLQNANVALSVVSIRLEVTVSSDLELVLFCAEGNDWSQSTWNIFVVYV